MLFTLQAIFLGIVQGITEFIPVSSSGHLVLANYFIGFELQDITFEIALHFGTVMAVILFFRKDIMQLFSAAVNFRDRSQEHIANRKVIGFLAVGTIVTGVLGFSFKAMIEQIFHQPIYSAVMIIVTGLIIFISDYIPSRKLTMSETGIWRSIVIGISQALAIMPGISRSGTTIATGMYIGLKRDDAARFSFLLSIPAILGATFYEMKSFAGIVTEHLLGYILGTIAAFISGYLVIALLLAMIRKRRLKIFSFYCWAVGIFSVVYILLNS